MGSENNILEQQNILDTVDELFDRNEPKEALKFLLDKRKEAKNTGNTALELTVLNELIGYYRQTSEKENLLNTIEDSLSILNKEGDNKSLRYATVVLNIANAYRSLSMPNEAKKYYAITNNIYEEKIASGDLLKDDLLVAGLYNNESLLCQEISDYEGAKAYLLKALFIVESRKAGFEIAVTYANLANTCVLLEEYEEAKEYALISIRLFRARALKDAHYCAALSALATCYFKEGQYHQAAVIFEEAMNIVKNTIGENLQYEKIKNNLLECQGKIGSPSLNGLDISKAYYDAFGKEMIHKNFPEYENKIAIGLVGEGSECFGFDDLLSTDHDFGPDFCMFVTDETYDEIGKKLNEAYDELPDEYMGCKRTVTSTGTGRRGVIKISDFYSKFIGIDNYEHVKNTEDIDYSSIEDYALAAAVNGEIFIDDEGIFTKIREELKKGYPEKIKMLKIAQCSAMFCQNAQYNYLRMLKREDETSAGIMLMEGIKNALKLFHYISNVYPPHDKWLNKSTKRIEGSEEFIILIDQIMGQYMTKTDKKEIVDAIEKLGAYFADRMYSEGIISDVETYLDYHTEEILFKAGIVELTNEEIVDKIVRIEFEAFDKVKNEGGRAYCQNDWPTFSVMRKSQYLTWDHEMLIQYLYDFTREYNRGHNLITEKYGRMMESTDLDRWNEIKDNFPELTEEKKAVINQIVDIQMIMMEEFAKEHPYTASNARTLHTYEDSIIDTSYETYLRGEISTYSDKMLQLYGKYVVMAYRNGVNIAYNTMENTAKLYGFSNLIEFENTRKK